MRGYASEPFSDGNCYITEDRYSIENRELKSAIEPSEADLGRHHLIGHTIVFVLGDLITNQSSVFNLLREGMVGTN